MLNATFHNISVIKTIHFRGNEKKMQINKEIGDEFKVL
jgi:hypothetical protein